MQIFRYILLLCVNALIATATAAQLSEPKVQVMLPAGSIYTNTPFHVFYSLHWEDETDSYIVIPEALPDLSWGNWRVQSVSSAGVDDAQEISVDIEIIATQAGNLGLPALSFAYSRDTEDLENAERGIAAAPEQAIQITSADAQYQYMLYGAAGVIFLLVVGGVTALLILLRRTKGQDDSKSKDPEEVVRDSLHSAQRCRLDGDYYGYYQALSEVAGIVAAKDKELVSLLDKRTQSVGYGGVRPTEDELNGDQREIERAVARWKEERAK